MIETFTGSANPPARTGFERLLVNRDNQTTVEKEAKILNDLALALENAGLSTQHIACALGEATQKSHGRLQNRKDAEDTLTDYHQRLLARLLEQRDSVQAEAAYGVRFNERRKEELRIIGDEEFVEIRESLRKEREACADECVNSGDSDAEKAVVTFLGSEESLGRDWAVGVEDHKLYYVLRGVWTLCEPQPIDGIPGGPE